MSPQWLMFKLQIHGQTSLVSKTANVYNAKIHMLVPNLTLYIDIDQLRSVVLHIHVQWNMSNPTQQETREMCQIIQDVGKLSFYFS